jgi:hypothetical protein
MTLKCHCCGEDIAESDKKLCATFNGRVKSVCADCGQGIFNGLQILRDVGVDNEYLPDDESR